MDMNFTGSFLGEEFGLANRFVLLSAIDSLVVSNTKLTVTFQIFFKPNTFVPVKSSYSSIDISE